MWNGFNYLIEHVRHTIYPWRRSKIHVAIYDLELKRMTCPVCKGRGEYEQKLEILQIVGAALTFGLLSDDNLYTEVVTCKRCNGTGSVSECEPECEHVFQIESQNGYSMQLKCRRCGDRRMSRL